MSQIIYRFQTTAGHILGKEAETYLDAPLHAEGNISGKEKKAKMLPISVLFKARKL